MPSMAIGGAFSEVRETETAHGSMHVVSCFWLRSRASAFK